MDLWTLLTGLACLTSIASSVYVLRRPPPPPLWPSVPIAIVATAFFTVGEFFTSRVARTVEEVWLANLLLYAGVLLLGPAVWTMGLRFAESHQQPFSFGRAPWTKIPLVVSALLFVLLVTNPVHGQVLVVRVGERNEYLWMWYVLAGLTWGVLLAGVMLFLISAQRARTDDCRVQARVMAAGCSMPLLLNVFYIALPQSLPADPSTIGMAAACLLFVAGSYRRRLFSLIPVAFWEVLQQDSDGVLVLDARRRLLYANPPAEKLLQSVALRPDSDVFPRLVERLRRRGDDAPVQVGEVLAEEGEGPRRLFRVLDLVGHWLRIELTPLLGARGSRVGYCLRLRDETALQNAHDALAEQSAVISAVLVSTDDAFLVTDLDGSVLFVTHRFEELFDLEPIGSGTAFDQLASSFVGRLGNPLESIEGLAEVFAHPELSRRGQVDLEDGRTIEWSYYPLARAGRPGGRIWQIRDVTEQRRAADELLEAQKLESLGLIAGGVAHDFNNLLAVIQGNATLASRALPPEAKAFRFLRDIDRAATRASELTEKLLAYAGKSALEIAEYDLSSIVDEIRQLLDVSIPKRVELLCELNRSLPAIEGDVSQLRQVVMNLVLNAAESLDEGVGNIWVRTGESYLYDGDFEGFVVGNAQPGRHVYLEVEDTGCGMDPEVVDRIFEPFYSTKFTGRGLGLAATMGVVRTHHGALRVRSEPGEGSTFTLFLPAGENRRVGVWAH